MNKAAIRTDLSTVCVVLLAALGLLTVTGTAQAAPGTVSGPALSLTVSDTTPTPGETITVSETNTLPFYEVGASNAAMGFGNDLTAGQRRSTSATCRLCRAHAPAATPTAPSRRAVPSEPTCRVEPPPDR